MILLTFIFNIDRQLHGKESAQPSDNVLVHDRHRSFGLQTRVSLGPFLFPHLLRHDDDGPAKEQKGVRTCMVLQSHFCSMSEMPTASSERPDMCE